MNVDAMIPGITSNIITSIVLILISFYTCAAGLFTDLKKTAALLGGYNKLFTTNIYKEWLNEINIIRHNEIIDELKIFLKSNKYCNV
jgi:hypothetical protein